jgi:hypothetical protein
MPSAHPIPTTVSNETAFFNCMSSPFRELWPSAFLPGGG